MQILQTGAICALLAGCGGYSIHQRDNDHRNAMVHKFDEVLANQKDWPHICMEPVGPAFSLKDITVSATGEAKGVEGKLEVKSQESLAKLFEVTEILQLAHATYYRLCEAAGNGHYGNAFRDGNGSQIVKDYLTVFDKTQDLLEIQLAKSRVEAKVATQKNLAKVEADVEATQTKRSALNVKLQSLQQAQKKNELSAADIAATEALEAELSALDKRILRRTFEAEALASALADGLSRCTAYARAEPEGKYRKHIMFVSGDNAESVCQARSKSFCEGVDRWIDNNQAGLCVYLLEPVEQRHRPGGFERGRPVPSAP